MAKPQVTLTIGGDATSIDKAFDKVGASAKTMAAKLDSAEADAKKFGKAMDTAADKADRSESKFMGTADVLDGLGTAFGLPIGRATELARAMGDLSGGFAQIGPMIGKAGGAMQAFMLGPMGMAILGIASVTAAVILLYNKFEWFRDAVNSVVNPIKRAFESLFGGIGDGAKFSAEKFEKHMAELKAEGDAVRAKTKEWTDAVGGHIKGMNNPLEEFAANHELTLRKVRDNMIANIEATTNWTANLKELAARGFEDIAVEMLKLGPTAALAVEDATNRSDAELEKLRNEFVRYGAITGEDYTKELARTLNPAGALADSWMAGINEKIRNGGLAAISGAGQADRQRDVVVRVQLDGRDIHQSLLRLQRTNGPLGFSSR